MNQMIHAAPLCGTVASIPSKSQAHRLLICAALANDASYVQCSGTSADILATVHCLQGLGAEIRRVSGGFVVEPVGKSAKHDVLKPQESGSTLRFLLPVAGALGFAGAFEMEGRLPQRPLAPLDDELLCHGMQLSRPAENLLAVSGQLCSGAYTLPGDVSSQFISGLLFALPLLPGDSTLTITGKWESVEYIHMTLRALRQYGIAVTQTATGFQIPGGQTYRPPVEAVVEGDWSNAAFWLCAGALTDAGLTVRGLDPESPQGDKEILSILRQFGAQVQCSGDAITVSGGNLQGIVLDASDVPDLVPVVSVVAAAANGETRITGAARLRIKESDRLEAVSALLSALGGNVQQLPDGLIIQGGTPLTGGTVSAFGDHRIAMSAAVAAMLANGPVTVTGAQAVEKSYPAFWGDYQKLGGVVSPANEEV